MKPLLWTLLPLNALCVVFGWYTKNPFLITINSVALGLTISTLAHLYARHGSPATDHVIHIRHKARAKRFFKTRPTPRTKEPT